MNLSSSSLVGGSHVQILKFRGRISQTEVVAMVGSGASHNLIKRSVVEKLGILCNYAKHCGVKMGIGIVVEDTVGMDIIDDFVPRPL